MWVYTVIYRKHKQKERDSCGYTPPSCK
uniref:Uncharacterized protein n=1 Tax=Rhizophora mucronata TaxID=61149 RepID=A0A2P2LGK8_RHIMU